MCVFSHFRVNGCSVTRLQLYTNGWPCDASQHVTKVHVHGDAGTQHFTTCGKYRRLKKSMSAMPEGAASRELSRWPARTKPLGRDGSKERRQGLEFDLV